MELPKALLVGCGQGSGSVLAEHLSKDYAVTELTSRDGWDWRDVGMNIVTTADDDFDLIVFNQNGGSLPNNLKDGIINIDDWNQTLFTNHQLIYYLTVKQKKPLKVICVVTGFIRVTNDSHPQLKEIADDYRTYTGLKMMNIELMKMFSRFKEGTYCCIAHSFSKKDIDTLGEEMYNTIMSIDESYNRKICDETGVIYEPELY